MTRGLPRSSETRSLPGVVPPLTPIEPNSYLRLPSRVIHLGMMAGHRSSVAEPKRDEYCRDQQTDSGTSAPDRPPQATSLALVHIPRSLDDPKARLRRPEEVLLGVFVPLL